MSEKPLGLLSKCPNSKFQMTEWARKSLATLLLEVLGKTSSTEKWSSPRVRVVKLLDQRVEYWVPARL